MTRNEVERKLKLLTEENRIKIFHEVVNTKCNSIDSFLKFVFETGSKFSTDVQLENQICRLLKLKTEREKTRQMAVISLILSSVAILASIVSCFT